MAPLCALSAIQGVISPLFFTGIVSPRVHHAVLLSGFISNSGRYTQKHLRLFKGGGGTPVKVTTKARGPGNVSKRLVNRGWY